MINRVLAVLGLMAMLAVGAPSLMADHGNKGKHDNQDSQGWERRDGYEYRTYGHDERPPGWSHGKKTGWGDCGMPPGQAKKHGCRSYVYEGRRYYYHHDDDGRIVVRRPIIEAQGSITVH
ncbi:MAG TPA: hypothetical protein VH437_04900 [Terriglobales bacterium]